MAEAPGKHDPTFLPSGIPVPQDDGAARHLTGMRLPDLALPATRGGAIVLRDRNTGRKKSRIMLARCLGHACAPNDRLPVIWSEPGAVLRIMRKK